MSNDDDDLEAALRAHLSQPADDDHDWDRAATELDGQLAIALSHGDELDRRMAAAIRLLDGGFEPRQCEEVQ